MEVEARRKQRALSASEEWPVSAINKSWTTRRRCDPYGRSGCKSFLPWQDRVLACPGFQSGRTAKREAGSPPRWFEQRDLCRIE